MSPFRHAGRTAGAPFSASFLGKPHGLLSRNWWSQPEALLLSFSNLLQQGSTTTKIELMGKRVLIYGGSGGIGFALAKMLRARDYELHLVGRDRDRLAASARELGATFTAGDVEDSELFPRVAKEAGDSLDGLVYAVGTIHLKSLTKLTGEDFLRDFRLNALGAALAVQASLPALQRSAQQASVVFFSSVAAK